MSAKERGKRSLTIRLKLTLWYGFVFILGGVILIAANYYMVRNSLNIAPEKARAAVVQKYGLNPGALEFGHFPGANPGQPMDRYVTVDGIPLPRLIDEAQSHLSHRAGDHGGVRVRPVLAGGRPDAPPLARHNQHGSAIVGVHAARAHQSAWATG